MKTLKRILSIFLAVLMSFSAIYFTGAPSASAIYNFTIQRQNVSTWKNVKIGGGTMYDTACGIFSLINAVGCLTGKDMGVKSVAQWAHDIGAYNPGTASDGTRRSSLYPKVQAKYGSKYGFTLDCNGTSGYWETSSSSRLKNHLKNGGVAIGHVPSHFIAIVEYSDSKGYHIYDSYPTSGRGTNSNNGNVWVSTSKLASGKLDLDWFCLLSKADVELTNKLNGYSPITSITDGAYYRIKSEYFGTYLTRNSDNTISVKEQLASNDQLWKMKKNSDSTYTIINASNNYALDISGAGTTDGTAITAHTANDSKAQKFYAYNFGGGYLFRASYLQDSVLDMSKSKATTQLWTYEGTSLQRYSLEKVDVGDNAKLNGNSPITGIPDGSYYRIKSEHFGTYLTRNSDNSISVQALSASDNQLWKMQMNSDNTYSIINAGSGGAVSISGSGTANGTAITVATANGGNNQKFYAYNFDGGFLFRASYMLNGMFDMSKSKEIIQLWEYEGTALQRYSLEKVDVAGNLPIRNLGNFNTHLKLSSGKYLGVNGTNVEATTEGVNWKFTYNSTNGTYTISEPNGKVIDCQGGDIVGGTNIQIYNSNGTVAQQFYIYNIDGKYVFKPNGGSPTAESVVIDVDAPTQNAHLYRYSTSNAAIAAQRFTFAKAPAVINSCTASNVTYTGYNIQAKVTGYSGNVKISTWAEANGVVDTVTYEGAVSNGIFNYRVNVSDHGYQSGEYKSEIYVYNADGDVTVTTLTVIVPASFEIIDGSTTTFDGTYVSPKGKKKTASQIAADFKCVVSVYTAAGVKLSDDATCGTGCVVKHFDNNGEVLNSAVVVINGDVNGDSDITATDMVSIQAYIMSTTQLNGAYATAADVNGDAKITSSDYLQVLVGILGIC